MKICAVSFLFPNPEKPIFGSYIKEQLCELAKKHEVHIITRGKKSWGLKDEEIVEGIHVHRVRSENSLLFPFLCAILLWKLNRRLRFDLVHSHFTGYLTLVMGATSKVLSIPFFITVYGISLDHTAVTFMKRANIWISFLFAQKIISISTYTKKLALHYASANKHAIVTPGITLDKLKPCMGSSEFRKKNALGSGPLLLSIGGLVPRKGQDLILKALPKAIEKFPDLTYVIIGKGDSERDLKKICSDLGLEKNVIFWPNWVSDSDLANFYNACDIFALMSRTEGDAVEGFGIVYVEANALGKPVIGGRGGGTPDAVADGKSGFLLDPSDEKGLREKLLLLLGDKKLRDKMGEYGKKFAIGTHQWKDKIAQLETIYQEKVK